MEFLFMDRSGIFEIVNIFENKRKGIISSNKGNKDFKKRKQVHSCFSAWGRSGVVCVPCHCLNGLIYLFNFSCHHDSKALACIVHCWNPSTSTGSELALNKYLSVEWTRPVFLLKAVLSHSVAPVHMQLFTFKLI